MHKGTLKNLLVFSLIGVGSSAFAASDTNKDIVKAGNDIRENAMSYIGEGGIEAKEIDQSILQLAQEIVDASAEKMDKGRSDVLESLGIDMDKLNATIAASKKSPDESKGPMMQGEWVDVLLSRSMGESDIKATIEELSYSKIPVRVVFRGIPSGYRLNDAFSDYARWNDSIDNKVAGTIDPTIFRNQATQTVPRMVFMKDDKALASVDGLTNPDWLVDQFKNKNKTGYLGVRGPVIDISERDLIEVMQERLAKIDLESKKEQTVNTYWSRAKFVPMRSALEDRRRYLDPSIVINKDIRDGNGNLLTAAGSVINPLEIKSFDRRLIVFNPNNENEVKWLKTLTPIGGIKDLYIASEFSSDNGWKQLEFLQDMLDEPVYLLQNDVWQRFDLERTPSVITSENLHFVIDEFDVVKHDLNKK